VLQYRGSIGQYWAVPDESPANDLSVPDTVVAGCLRGYRGLFGGKEDHGNELAITGRI
jgi:hypothetical protein